MANTRKSKQRKTEIESVPTKLRVVNGEVVMADGSNLKEYLLSKEFPPNMELTLINSSYVTRLEEEYRRYKAIYSGNFNSAA